MLTMGVWDLFSEIEGYEEDWGKNDRFQRRHKRAAVLVTQPVDASHFHNVGTMLQLGRQDVRILARGGLVVTDEKGEDAIKVMKYKGIAIDERRILKLVVVGGEEEQGLDVVSEDGEVLSLASWHTDLLGWRSTADRSWTS